MYVYVYVYVYVYMYVYEHVYVYVYVYVYSLRQLISTGAYFLSGGKKYGFGASVNEILCVWSQNMGTGAYKCAL